MTTTKKFHIFAYYLLSIVVLSIFAFRSIASYDDYPKYIVILLIALPYFVAGAVRFKLETMVQSGSYNLDQPKRQFFMEIGLFALVAMELFCFEYFIYKHEVLLALKIFTWAMILGYFASIDSALHRMRNGFFDNHSTDVIQAKTFPVSQKLNLFLSTTVLLITLATAISAYSYINIDLKPAGIASAEGIKQEFIVDTLFILGLVISLTTRIIFSYSVNLQHMFETQINVLKNAQEGQLDQYVPVLSRDEFGIIAQQTNKMINQLRDKDKIQKTLERIVSPNIMHKLLHGNSAELKQGKQYNLAILFCDLRKFTSYAENTPPEEVIFFLNAYFTKIADIVAEHGGIVNKFIGDAILAVFGVEEEAGYVERAVDTAWDILMHSGSAVMRDGSTFDIGIGIHVGRAAAGTIGSADRFEYTFIGDAVNTASRLDGLSKRLGHKVVISSDVYKVLQPDTQVKFTDLGEQAIRGKTLPLHVYGAVPRDSNPNDKIVNFEPKKSAG